MDLKYEITKIFFDNLVDKIILPNFQRTVVWKKKQKEEFINTVVKGEPFGSIMLYQDFSEKSKYQIVDGLQRITTLIDFRKNPFNYFPLESLKLDYIDNVKKIIKSIYTTDEGISIDDEEVLEDIYDSIKKSIQENPKESRLFAKLTLEKIAYKYDEINKTQAENIILEYLILMWEHIGKKFDISNLEIPTIIYKGKEEDLPTIFYNLNQKGTKLSKYEVFASHWNNVLLSNVDDEILVKVEERYKELYKNAEIEIKGYTEGDILRKRQVTLYEFAHAFGKILKSNKLIMIKSQDEADKVDSIGFATLNTFLGNRLKDMNRLDDFINSNVSSANLNRFIRVIKATYDNVQEILFPYTKYFVKYIEAQILAITYTWFKIHFEMNYETLELIEKKNVKEYEDKFRKYMPYRYLYEILSSSWSGHGDNTLYNIIQMSLDENPYLKSINHDVWELKLNELLENQIFENSKNISQENKILLSFIMYQLNNTDDADFTFIIPKTKLQKIKEPISYAALGNIYLLPKKYSKYKKDYLPEKINIRSRTFYYASEQLLKPLMDNLTKETYDYYLKEQHKYLIETFINNLPY